MSLYDELSLRVTSEVDANSIHRCVSGGVYRVTSELGTAIVTEAGDQILVVLDDEPDHEYRFPTWAEVARQLAIET